MQRPRAVVPAAHRDAAAVQELRHVVRVHPGHVEADRAAAVDDLPDDVRALPTVGRGSLLYPDLLAHPLDLAGDGADAALLDVDAGVLAALAARRIAAGEEMPVEPLYLRRPDAVAPASTAPKSALKPSPRQQQRDLRQGERAGRGAEASQ